MWMPASHDRATGTHRLQRHRHELTGGCEHDCPIAGLRRHVGRVAHPLRAELTRELTVVFAPRHHHHLTPPVPQHLQREVRRRAEAEQRDALARLHLGPSQSAVPDHPGAEERRSREVVERGRKDHGEVLGYHDHVGVPAVDRPPGELGGDAQVLLAAPRQNAQIAARAVQPRHADPVADHEAACIPSPRVSTRPHHLMTGHPRAVVAAEIALDDVEIGATAPARVHAHRTSPPPRCRIGTFDGTPSGRVTIGAPARELLRARINRLRLTLRDDERGRALDRRAAADRACTSSTSTLRSPSSRLR